MDEENKFLEAYEKYSDAIFRHCYFRLNADRERAKDMAQETFLRAWKYISEGKKVDNIRAFLYRVATNLIIDHVRKKNFFSLEMIIEKGGEPEMSGELERIRNKTDLNILLKSLQKLKERERQVIVLRYIDDLSLAEISEVTGDSEGAIATRIHRSVKKLKERFGQ